MNARRPTRAEQEAAERRRRWATVILMLLLLLLLLLLWPCREEEPPAPAPAPPVPAATAAPRPPPPVPEARVQVPPSDRPAYAPEDPGGLPWLASLRQQVAARSPRLARCFVGVDQPGRLRWSAAVAPATGQVSDPTIEPTLGADPLSSEQRECVLGVLADPPYRLGADGRSTPTRVGLVIEF